MKVDTVDSYQGKQNPIVVLSSCAKQCRWAAAVRHSDVREGFLSRSNRINVSISRAMDRLVIVGTNGRWPRSGPMGRLAGNFAKALGKGEATRDSRF